VPTYTLLRYQGALPLVETPFEACDDVIYLIARVGDYEHRAHGFDAYWTAGDRYGVTLDPENVVAYGGRAALAYRWDDAGHVELDDPTPPADAVFARGILVPDPVAREIGIL
jgi:hypothetical protein